MEDNLEDEHSSLSFSTPTSWLLLNGIPLLLSLWACFKKRVSYNFSVGILLIWVIFLVNSNPDRLHVDWFVVWLDWSPPLFGPKHFDHPLGNLNLFYFAKKNNQRRRGRGWSGGDDVVDLSLNICSSFFPKLYFSSSEFPWIKADLSSAQIQHNLPILILIIIVNIIFTIMFVYSRWTVGGGGTNCISITVTNPSLPPTRATLPSQHQNFIKMIPPTLPNYRSIASMICIT